MENQNNPVSFFRFEDLRVYHKSIDYCNWISEELGSETSTNQKTVAKALSKAAIKASVCIAEGSSRHKAQFVNFLKDAKTAVRECVVLSTIAYKNGVFTESQHEQSKEFLVEMTKMLGAMIVSLQRNNPREDSSEAKTDFNSSTEISFEY